MALSDSITSQTREAYHRVKIAGLPFMPIAPTDSDGNRCFVTDISYRESFDQPCPVCTIETSLGVDWINGGDSVEVNLGYDGENRRVFTGTVQQRSRPSVATGQYECAGELWRLVRATFDEPRDVGGLTVAQGIVSIFDDVGIANYDVTAVPAYTLASTATIAAGTGMAQLSALMAVDGLRVRETGAGQVIVARYEGSPSASAFRKYSTDGENVRILDGGVTEDPGWYRTQITVVGARIADGSDVTATVTLSDTSLAQPPLPTGEQIADTYSIPLIWDTAKATEAATRLGIERGRIPQTFRMRIPMDMQLEIGSTLAVSAPEWNVSGNWLIWSITHNVAADTTEVNLVGGPQFGGTINVNPIAAFTFTAENQPLGSQRYTYVTLDASASFQPDNVDEVLTYDWSGDQDAADSPAIDSQTAAKFTTQIDPTAMVGDVLTVTLVVTNEAGLTATVIHAINITPEGTDSIVVGLYAALKTRFAASLDGGETWNFQSGTDITSVAAMPPTASYTGYACFGRDNGQIYRTTDGCATAPTSVRGSTAIAIVDIKWDWRDPTKVWALDANCNLLLSPDYGLTWSTIVAWRTAMSLSTIIGKRILLRSDGYVWVFGGTGVTSNGRPFIGRFKSGSAPFGFASAFGGELATDLGSGTTTLAVADAVYQANGGLLIVLENYTAYNGAVYPAYWVPDPFLPTGWQRIGNTEGFDAGVTTAGRVALPGNGGADYFHIMFNDQDAWHINCSSGTPVATVTNNFLDAGFTPNEGLWMADEQEGVPGPEVHIIAVEDAAGNGAINKSFDDMLTQADILPGMTAWPVVGAKGKDVAIGPPASLGSRATVVIAADVGGGDEGLAAWRTGAGPWRGLGFAVHATKNLDFARVRALTSTLWFTYMSDFASDFEDSAVRRTKDGGTTWDDPFAAPTTGGLTRYWQDFARDASGRIWGVTLEGAAPNHCEVWYSDDEGDNWTESKDDATAQNLIWTMLCHPTNANRIYAFGGAGAGGDEIRVLFTTNGGSSWTLNTHDINISVSAINNALTKGAMVLSSNRLVCMFTHHITGLHYIFVSDDNGDTWTSTKNWNVGGTSTASLGPVGDPMGNRLFVMIVNQSVSPYDIQIHESTDQGTTWTEIVSDALGNGPPQPGTLDHYRGGMAYDPTEGALYLFGAGEGNSNNINQVVKTVGLGWQDVSAALNPIDGHASYSINDDSTHGIAVIPS